MAELATLGAIASIIQVVDVTVRVACRVSEYRELVGKLPKMLEHIDKRLPTLLSTLRQMISVAETMSDETRKAVMPCITGCRDEMEKLEVIIDKITPREGDSSTTRSRKALRSIIREGNIKEMNGNIRMYLDTLAQHQTILSSAQGLASKNEPPQPSSTCPFEQESDFVERDVMSQVLSRCQSGNKLALIGIGGVGKSRIAIEYNYRVRQAFPQTWVFWISCETQATIARDFRKIGKALQVQSWAEDETDIFMLVRDWLKDESHGPWCMILDNVDDTSALTAPAPAPPSSIDNTLSVRLQVKECFSMSTQGSILVTSKNTEAAQMITGNCAYHIDVEEMNEGEAVALLKTKFSSKVVFTEDEAKKLVNAVDYMPLAVSQIATNISMKYPCLTLSKVIDQLQNPSSETMRLLETSFHETSRDVNRTNSIVKTWHLSFEHVRETYPSAARLLSLMCLFNRQGIPQALLSGQYGEEKKALASPSRRSRIWLNRIKSFSCLSRRKTQKTQTVIESRELEYSFDEDWRVLTNFAFINTNIDGSHFTMHRLFQHATKRWLDLNDELKGWQKRYIAIMRDCFPQKRDFDTSEVCQYLFPHALEAEAYRPADNEILQKWASLMLRTAVHALGVGTYPTAERLSRAVFELYKTRYGDEDERTLDSAQILATSLHLSKQSASAETLFKWLLPKQTRVLGAHHDETVSSMNGLGCVLYAQGKMDEGDKLMRKRIDTVIQAHGMEDSFTQLYIQAAAMNFFMRGMYKEAEEMHKRTYEQAMPNYGEYSIDALTKMSILGGILKMQGKYDEAESVLRKVLEGKRKNFSGVSHTLLVSIVKLADTLEARQKFEEAEALFREAVQGYETLYSPEDSQALETQERIALLLGMQQRYREAEEIARYVVETRERKIGREDNDMFIAYHSLAVILYQRGNIKDSLVLYEKAFVGLKKVVGADHPDTREFCDDYTRVNKEWHELIEGQQDVHEK